MARALAQIIQELNSVYNPQRDVYNKQIKGLAGEQEGELKGLEAAKTDSFGQIVQGANRRGVAFGGIPLEEQGKYLGQTYLPAVANLKNRFNQQRFNLQDALAQIGIKQREQAYGIYGNELDREEAAKARAAASSGGGGGIGGFDLGGAVPEVGQVKGASSGYGYKQRSNKGFNFVDPNGRPISAATYAKANGMSFRDLLQFMANKGDSGAKRALGFVGNDFGYDPRKIGGNASLYNNLIWGAPVRQAALGANGGGGGW